MLLGCLLILVNLYRYHNVAKAWPCRVTLALHQVTIRAREAMLFCHHLEFSLRLVALNGEAFNGVGGGSKHLPRGRVMCGGIGFGAQPEN
jgi:hypothetical protein